MCVLIISEEARITGLVQEALGQGARLSTITQWNVAKTALTQVRFDLICLDYECIKNETPDAVVSLRSLLALLDTTLCLLVRRVDADVERFQAALPRIDEVIDMSQGSAHFSARLARQKEPTSPSRPESPWTASESHSSI